MYDLKFLNTSQGIAKTNKGRQGLQNKRPIQDHGDKGDSLKATPLKPNERN